MVSLQNHFEWAADLCRPCKLRKFAQEMDEGIKKFLESQGRQISSTADPIAELEKLMDERPELFPGPGAREQIALARGCRNLAFFWSPSTETAVVLKVFHSDHHRARHDVSSSR